MHRVRNAAGLALVLLLAGSPAFTQDPQVVLNVVKYDGLKEAVLKNRGKVVLVDVWALF